MRKDVYIHVIHTSLSRIKKVLQHWEDAKDGDQMLEKEEIPDALLSYIRKRQTILKELSFSDSIYKNYVVQAFMFPAVNSDMQPFCWRDIDYSALDSFCRTRDNLDVHRLLKMIDPAVQNQHRDVQRK